MASATKSQRPKRRTRVKAEHDSALDYALGFPYLSDLKFLEDASGERSAVVIPLEGFRRLMRDYWALTTVVNSKEEDFIDFEEFVSELRADGLLPPES